MKSHPHDSARGHVTGTAEYIDDRPFVQGEVHVEVFYSPVARARIRGIDTSKAEAMPGVVGVFTARDLAHNRWGTIFQDQPFLADTTVEFVGEAIAVVAAETVAEARAARRLIEVDLEALEPILTIESAIDQKAFIGPARKIARGNVDEALARAPHRLAGHVDIAGQDHFYLESHACIAYPKEENQVEIHSSAQHPTEVQHLVAEALGLKFNQVVCIVKRMGGAFGGKESQSGPFAVYAALVAQKLGRAARVVITKDDDMIMTGKRNPFKNFYEVGFDDEGRILGLKVSLFSDGGAYADLSTAIMERAMLHTDNAYFIPAFRVEGQVCKTNTPPNTAFRGFGGPKGVVTIESVLEDIAVKLGRDAFDVRLANVYQKGQTTPYGQEIDDAVLPDLFRELGETSRYADWRRDISAHNEAGHSTLRGLSLTAVKFGISFTTRFLNQGNALVNLHLDGTIQVSTGATEMGQGVNVKIAQVVADCFAIPLDWVRVMATSTEKNPNTSATAASSGADINCQAALNASLAIRENLARVAKAALERPKEWRGRAVAGAGTAPEMDLHGVSGWEEVVFQGGKACLGGESIGFVDLLQEAYLNRVPLMGQGFFRYPGVAFNKETGQGRPFFYYTNGVAASEVSVDRETGEVKVQRTELLMDLGRPLNEGVDLGQVTGAFVQGMGWVTTESLFYDKGFLVSHSPSTYKIPTVHDIPRTFRCKLAHNPLNERNVGGSKAVGEPPLLLAISVFTAVKDALRYVAGAPVPLKLPATQEQVFLKLEEHRS